jgi:hypothetical protein
VSERSQWRTDRDGLVATAFRIEAMEMAGANINPIKSALDSVPDRARTVARRHFADDFRSDDLRHEGPSGNIRAKPDKSYRIPADSQVAATLAQLSVTTGSSALSILLEG